MDVRVLVSALLRRWYLVLPALILAASGTYFVVDRIGPTYTAEASILLLPPTSIEGDGSDTVQVNPYMSLGGLTPARDVLVHTMTSRSAREAIEKQYPGSDYDFLPDITVSGPLISVQASSSSKATAIALLNDLTARTPQALLDLQGNLAIKGDVRITAQTLAADRTPQTVHKGQIRAGIVVAGGLLCVLLLAICLLDGLLMAHRRAAARETAEPKAERRPRRTRGTRGAVAIGEGLADRQAS